MYFGSRIDKETSFQLLDRYYDAGGRFIDTANNYATWLDGFKEPRSERLLGEWMAERDNRDELFLATKLGFTYGDVPRGLSPELIRQEHRKSLDRLGVDTVDLLYAHVDDFETPQSTTMREFHRLVTDGTVRSLGASNFLAWRVQRANAIAEHEGWTSFSCVQPRYSYLIPNRGAEFGPQVPATDELVDYCDRNGLTVLPYSPLLGGTYGRDDRPLPEQYVNTENELKLGIVREVADAHGVDGNQVVLAWLAHSDPVRVPVLGCSTVEQLDANLNAFDLDLSSGEMRRLNSIETLGAISR